MPTSFEAWLLAARPKTLLASLAPVAIGTVLAQYHAALHVPTALACLTGAVAIQIGTNFCNDYFDFVQGADTAHRLGPRRAVASGWISPLAMRAAAGGLFVVALGMGGYLAAQAGWIFLVLAVLAIGCGIWYTAGRYSLAYLGLGEPFVLVFFGPVAVGGSYYVQAHRIGLPILIAGLAPGLMSVALLAVNNLRDLEEDRLANKRTLAVRLGHRFARCEYVLCMVLSLLVPVILWSPFDFPALVMLASLAGVIAMPACWIVWYQQGRSLNRVLGLTALVLLSYSVLFGMGLLWP